MHGGKPHTPSLVTQGVQQYDGVQGSANPAMVQGASRVALQRTSSPIQTVWVWGTVHSGPAA
ncbi:hypothetical protein [Magnetococcus sp. PR-3]|uniref:hypothetical protein n=1 Tax=Magnetococcus sp. PR-3 TaxID=3120355 RepID=UPI002FCE2207